MAKILELAGNGVRPCSRTIRRTLGMYEAKNGIVFSEALEFFGYLLNRIDEPVPVLPARRSTTACRSAADVRRRAATSSVAADQRRHFGAIIMLKIPRTAPIQASSALA